jgi:energy-coupling factor transporter ATP-binding protein EcfA2
MRLKSIDYVENAGTPQEWHLSGLELGAKNLIVGKNATGKSRCLNIINGLADYLSATRPVGIADQYNCRFVDGKNEYHYELHTKEDGVRMERLTINGDVKLDRGADGSGTIFAEQLDGGRKLPFQAPPNQIAALARRDNIQHKFLEPLSAWALSVRHIAFGSELGKTNFAMLVKGAPAPSYSDRETNRVVGTFRRAEKEFGPAFKDALLSDLAKIDYKVSEVGVQPPISVRFEASPVPPVGMYVKETDLPGITDQISMSQGQYRVMALLIYVNFFALRKSASCILIDDIGEGLDFERSCLLIDLLRQKADSTQTQVVFTSNDRFVMNKVPLEEWSVLERRSNRVTVRNYANSKSIFEDFKFTGLSNFSFLEMDIINNPPSAELNEPRSEKK